MARRESEVILISPPSNWIYRRIPYPPLGIAYLAAVGKEKGIDTKVIDGQFLQEYKRDLSEVTLRKDPCLVGISSTLLQLSESIEIAKRIKENNPNALIVFGGPGPSCLSPEEFFTRAGESVDLLSYGEGEKTWEEILEIFFGSTNQAKKSPPCLFEEVKGVVINEKGKITVNLPRPLLGNIDDIPMPDLEAVRARQYLEEWRRNSGITSISIVPSRGCPFGCIFCDKSVFGKRFRPHSPKRIGDEIERLITEYGPIDDIFFYDDNLSVDKKVLNGVCNEIVRRNLRIGWSCQARVDTIDENTLRNMKEAGCTDVYFGVETASQKLLDFLGKGITVEQAERAIELCHKVGIKPGCFLIVGIPGETREDIEALADFIRKTKPAFVDFSVLTPFPGTLLYQKTKHLIKAEALKKFVFWDDTRASVYKDGVFSVDPKTSITFLEKVFIQMLQEEHVEYDPSQFVKNRYE